MKMNGNKQANAKSEKNKMNVYELTREQSNTLAENNNRYARKQDPYGRNDDSSTTTTTTKPI